ncbi:RIO1 family protein [Candidatus Nanopusillus massiliensis]|uniref:hypothetical protein n=1 Tax=Candidatus Nanopusillus massiliensis TaxID=2897163 RepID=UPI001E300858|nr:hypothetical protein [Candidatus Nanopusillus massiliensis]
MKYIEIWKVYGKVFDKNTLYYLDKLYKGHYIEDDLALISEGKEAIVVRSGKFAIKIYKIMSMSFERTGKLFKSSLEYISFQEHRLE